MTAATDRELLELAAKAAGLVIYDWTDIDVPLVEFEGMWNPLTDDGDALRLAVKLGLMVDNSRDEGWCDIIGPFDRIKEDYSDHLDPLAATRRAIVRAAAEIGRRLP
jgi:hypothetical protein